MHKNVQLFLTKVEGVTEICTIVAQMAKYYGIIGGRGGWELDQHVTGLWEEGGLKRAKKGLHNFEQPLSPIDT